jgi:hypothetical protein
LREIFQNANFSVVAALVLFSGCGDLQNGQEDCFNGVIASKKIQEGKQFPPRFATTIKVSGG